MVQSERKDRRQSRALIGCEWLLETGSRIPRHSITLFSVVVVIILTIVTLSELPKGSVFLM